MDESHHHAGARSSAGGARAARGLTFQAQVFAWWAVRAIVEMPLTEFGLSAAVRVEEVGCETGLPVDDVGVTVSGGGFVLTQAKAGMRRLDAQTEDLVKAVDQIVGAFVHGIHTSSGARPVDLSRDRLVIATNHDGSRAFDQLGIVLMRLRGHPASLPLRAAAPTISQLRAFETFVDVVVTRWTAIIGREPSDSDLRAFLRCAEVIRLDLKEPDGADLFRSEQALRVALGDSLIDEPFTKLAGRGSEATAAQRWWRREELVQAVLCKEARRRPTANPPRNHLPALPQPYLRRGDHDFSDTGPATERLRIAVTGGPGLGKTTLAIDMANETAQAFPDGQLFVDFRGFGPAAPMSSAEAVEALLEQMGEADVAGKDPEGRRSHYLDTVEEKRFVITLDNIPDSESALPLLPRHGLSAVIVTSRTRLGTLLRRTDVSHIHLTPLAAHESRDLLVKHIGGDRTSAEPSAVDTVLSVCGGNPLALAIAGSHIRHLPGQPLDRIVSVLTDADSRLDFLDLHEPDSALRTVFSWTYFALPAELRDFFVLVGAAPGPDVDSAGASALTGSKDSRTGLTLLRRLRHFHLVQENAYGGFQMHELLRDYALSLCHGDRRLQDIRSRACDRLVRHYSDLAVAAATSPGTCLAAQDSPRFLAAVRYAEEHGLESEARAMVDALIETMWYHGRWNECAAMLRAITYDPSKPENPEIRSYFLRQLAVTLRRLGAHAESVECGQQALTALGQRCSARAEADCRYVLAVSHAYAEDHEAALEQYHLAANGFRETGDDSRLADTLNGIGWSLAMRGEHPEALRYCTRAADLHGELNVPNSRAADLDSIACIYQLLGDHETALRYFEQCLHLYREIGYRANEARTLDSMGDSALASGDRNRAIEHWRLVIAILEDIGHGDTDQAREIRVKGAAESF
ncbi:tetratricopeptide repeat protein [Streptosporangium amethystogenes]|uniref:tetratricopeptide repeat protein n=1 Tax=Streptosporangium amethystogenes TaxID=2002 RepID=UPI00379B5FBD